MSTTSKCEAPITVFLDRNVIARSVIVEGAVRRQRIQFGPNEQEIEIVGWKRKNSREGDARWLDQEVACLPTLARLAKDGVITLSVSREIMHESMSASIGARGIKGDILKDVQISQMPDAVERSYLTSLSLDQIVSRNSVINFCKFLRDATPRLFENAPLVWDSLPEEMQANIRNLDRFHILLDALPTNRHWPDALHLWTAETHGAEYFLTFDMKFINALTQTARIELPTKPALPSALLDDLEIDDRDPLPIEDFEFHDFTEMLD